MKMHPLIKTHASKSILSTHHVLRNTYALLGLSLLWSALCATAAVMLHLPGPNIIISLIGIYGLIFAVNINARNSMGIVFVFLFTGFMGYSLCPLLNMLLHSIEGTRILVTALSGTGVAFIALSAYALVSSENFSFLSGFLFTALIGCVITSALSLIFNSAAMSLLVACVMTVVSSGMILYQTSEIIHGGETNYILATVSLYVSIYNLFVSLLQILSMFRSRD